MFHPGGGGGYLGSEWIPTAKRPPRVEAVNLKARGGQLFFFLQNEEQSNKQESSPRSHSILHWERQIIRDGGQHP